MTRGTGLLEPYLARRRAQLANQLIPPALRGERILDIGCGSYPYFLAHTRFKEKFAIDQLAPSSAAAGIAWHQLDLNADPRLPFPDCFFSVITLLAVIEHLDRASLNVLFGELYRAVAPGGLVILTTPSAWGHVLLKWLARVNVVSAAEIREHRFVYALPLINQHLGRAGFAEHQQRVGYFELGLNQWATARR